ncbi:MAG: tetratricopeptide repeat protein [Candidatus Omnitrophica bacterium]|nr:tetratricopeptide repeat protein [Candidatus Omnitrophota bacterium]
MFVGRILLPVCLLITALPAGQAQPAADSPAKRQLDFALGLFQRGEYKGAAEEFDLYLSRPEWTEKRDLAAFFAGESFRLAGKTEESAKAYRALLALDATGEYVQRGRYRLGKILLDQGAAAEALILLEPLAGEVLPKEFREGVLYSLGAACSASGDSRKAIEWWTRYREEFPASESSRRALLGLGLETIRLQEWEKAAGHLEEWLKDPKASSDSSYSTVLANLAEAEERLGEKSSAAERHLALADLTSDPTVKDRALLAAGRLFFEQEDWGRFDRLSARTRKELAAPGSRLAWFVLEGNRFHRARKWKEALAAYSEGLPLAEGSDATMADPLRVRIGWCARALKDWERVRAHIEAAGLLGGASDEKAFLLGEAYRGLGKDAEAAESYAQVPEGSALKEQALFGESECAYRASQWERASALFERLLGGAPKGAERVALLLRAGDSKRQLSEWLSGANYYATATVETASPEARERALYLEGWCRVRGEDYPGAMRALRTFTEEFPKSAQRAEALYLLGQSAGKVGERSAQISAYESLAKDHPKTDWTAEGLVQLAAAYSAESNPEGVRSSLQRFQDLFPKRKLHREFALWLAEAQVRGGSHALALKTLETVLKEDLPEAERETCLHLRAFALEQLGKAEEARRVYREALERFPNGAKALHNHLGLGRTAFRLGEVAEASSEVVAGLELIRKTLVSEPSVEAQFYLLEGDIEFRAGRFPLAYRAYARTSILYHHPEHTPRALFLSALCKERMNEPEAALALRAELNRDYPDFNEESGRNLLKDLETIR